MPGLIWVFAERTLILLVFRHNTNFLSNPFRIFQTKMVNQGWLLEQRHYRHTCHKLWTEICEIRQIFKWDLIKFCEIFTKVTLKLPQNSQKPLLQCMKFVINTTKYFFIKCVVRWSKNSVRFENLMGTGFQMGQILWDFISQYETWHACTVRILSFQTDRPGQTV